MKHRIIFFLAALCTLAFAACEGDGDADYGFGKIYMPQAVSTGGLNNTYTVPAGGGENTRNFVVADGSVQVILGVARSGKLSEARPFSVEVYASESDSAAAAALYGGEAMPAGSYSLPATVNVAAGTNGTTFYLTIPAATLTAPEHAGKRLVLTVGLRNPSDYELAETAVQTVVLVDVDALKAYL